MSEQPKLLLRKKEEATESSPEKGSGSVFDPVKIVYELNMAELPFCLLESRTKNVIEKLTYQGTARVNGQEVELHWEVHPSKKYGLPGPLCQDLLFVLFRHAYLSGLEGEQGNRINFKSLFHLLKLLPKNASKTKGGWPLARLRDALDTLVATTIKTQFVLWDNTKRQRRPTFTWHPFLKVGYEGSEEIEANLTAKKYSFIEIDEFLKAQIESGGFVAIDCPCEVFDQLTPFEKRLTVYVSKMILRFPTHCVTLEDLAHRLPVEYTEIRRWRSRIKKHIEGLKQKGALKRLKHFDFFQGKNGEAYLRLRSTVKTIRLNQAPKQLAAAAKPLTSKQEYVLDTVLDLVQEPEKKNYWEGFVRALGDWAENARDLASEIHHDEKAKGRPANIRKILIWAFRKVAQDHNVPLPPHLTKKA